MTLKNTLRHLLPKSFQWNLVYGRSFVDLIDGIVPSLDAARDNADEVWADFMPATTDGTALEAWERQFNLFSASALTLQERRDRLTAAWSAEGGQSPGYITDTLTAHGFPVFTHEWWVLAPNDYPQPRDPRDHLKAEFGGTDADGFLIRNVIRTSVLFNEIGAGEAYAEAGEPDAVCGFFEGFLVDRVEATYQGPKSRHPYYLYIGGSTFPDTVDIPIERRDEFEHLCQRLCPAPQWLVLRVRYV